MVNGPTGLDWPIWQDWLIIGGVSGGKSAQFTNQEAKEQEARVHSPLRGHAHNELRHFTKGLYFFFFFLSLAALEFELKALCACYGGTL
jgi:hypothetical protein